MTTDVCKFCRIRKPAYTGAVFCGAACTAQAEAHKTPSRVEITWTCEEFVGTEVLKEGSDQPLTNKDDIKEGDVVLIGNLRGKYLHAHVFKDEDGWYATPPTVNSKNKYVVPLQFASDRRKCWVALGIVNKDALKQLKLEEKK
jgi:hypothetical protein